MTSPDQSRPRRRVRIAQAILRRVHAQRETFATAYGGATSPQARFNTAAAALRAAASERNQRDDPATARRLDELTGQITDFIDALHEAQEHRAHRVLRAEACRIARNERNRNHDHGNPEPEQERSGRTAAA